MAKEPKMKIGIGADTGDFEKGARKVKQEMKDLNKVSSDAFAAIGNALGVDVGKVQQFSSALAGLGNKLAQTGAEGASAFSKIGGAVNAVGVGIAGLGLAAAIAAFKQLNAEADAFEQTIQGGIIARQTESYISVFRQALRDQSGVGEQAAGFRQTMRMAGATLAGFFQSGFDFDRMREANALGERAKDIASELYDIEIKQKANSVEVARLDAEIARAREDMIDPSKSAAEHAAALALAQKLIKDQLDLQLPLAKRQRDLIVEYNGLASTTVKEYDAQIAAEIQVNNLIEQEAAKQRSLLRQQQRINNELKKTVEVKNELVRDLAPLERVTGITGPGAAVQVPTSLAEPNNVEEWRWDAVASIGDIYVGVKFDLDTKKVQDFTREVESALQGLAVNVGEILGQLAGDLATGGDAWGNFSNAAMSAFADMATAIGKIAIETGIAALGIEAAITSLGPEGAALAIAAGTALVALGAAVKAGLSNIASGNYSAGAGVAISSYSSYNTDYATREVNVNVTGTLKADGDQLVAVITNTQNNSYYQT